MMRPGPFFAFRLSALITALTLGVLSVWISAAELVRPRLPAFPSDSQDAQAFIAARSWTQAAALIGMMHGELWTGAATAEAAPYLFETDDARRAATPQTAIDTARLLAARAAKLSPHDSRNWLLLAALSEFGGASNINPAELLKLSYYTGPGNITLAPLRLSIATRSAAIADDELKTFVSLEVQQLAMKVPALKPLLATVYSNANADGRKVIEGAIAPIDPAFLNAIRQR